MQSFTYVVLRDPQKTISAQTKEWIDFDALHLSEFSFIVDGGEWEEYGIDEVCPAIKDWRLEVFEAGKHFLIEVAAQNLAS